MAERQALFREPVTRITEPITLADGAVLQPMGTTTSPQGRDVWLWQGQHLRVLGGPEDLPDLFCLVVAHDKRKPTSAERRMVREAFGLERTLWPVTLPRIPDPYALYVLGRRPAIGGPRG
jgi:hypothetical protein